MDPGGIASRIRSALIASGPLPRPPTALSSTAPQSALLETEYTYLSLPPGTAPEVDFIDIANATAPGVASIQVPVIQGGFDPVTIAARTSDVLSLTIHRHDGRASGVLYTVPVRHPPTIVRTSPPARKTDVPLNATIVVVFSQPIDTLSVDSNTVRLLEDSIPVPAFLVFRRDLPWRVEVIPTTRMFDPVSTYRVIVTDGVTDAGGEPIGAPFEMTFTTGTTGALEGSVNVIPSHVAIAPGESYVFTLEALDSAGTSLGTTRRATWSSIYPDIATVISTVNDSGRATGVTAGHTEIWGCSGDLCAYSDLYVDDPPSGVAPEDLGTLGGENSAAAAVNESGMIAGWAETATGDMHAFVYDRAVGMRDLGTLGGSTSWATAINDSGAVLGVSYTIAQDYPHVFLWTHQRGMEDITTQVAKPVPIIEGVDLNNHGEIVGSFLDEYSGFQRRPHDSFIWSHERGTKVLTQLGAASQARGVNDRGQVVVDIFGNDSTTGTYSALFDGHTGRVISQLGDGQSPNLSYTQDYVNDDGAYMWSKGTTTGPWDPWTTIVYRHLPTTGDTQFSADMIFSGARNVQFSPVNRNGDICGWAAITSGFTFSQPFLWTADGKLYKLGTLGGSNNGADRVNGNWLVVGASALRAPSGSADGPLHAVLWDLSRRRGYGSTSINAHKHPSP